MPDWFNELFINEAKKALAHHAGIGGSGESLPNTIILEDESGNQIAAMLTDETIYLTADPDTDIRDGKTAITSVGVVEGNKEIPNYHTHEGTRLVPAGSLFAIPNEDYDYTKFQAIICAYNTSLLDSVASKYVVINDNVYATGSTMSIATVFKDSENARIDLGMMNETGHPCVMRYFMYREEY